MYSARDIALYYLSKDPNHNIFTTDLTCRNGHNFYSGNARLNKYLHISQNLFYAKTGNLLFADPLLAYANGAVVNDVYRNYSSLLSNSKSFTEADNSVRCFLDKIFYVLQNASLEELIELSHEDSAWQEKRNCTGAEQKMDTEGHHKEYVEQYSDMLKVIDRIDL